MAFIRKVKTKSGATAVQIIHKNYGRITHIDHIGSAHNQEELTILLALARKKLQGDQLSLLPVSEASPIIQLKQSYSSLLWQVLRHQYDQLGFDQLQDDIFRALCIARLVEPTSKVDSLRVLADLGIIEFSQNQIYRCLPKVIANNYRSTISQLCFNHSHSKGINLLLYDVTTLYFEVQQEDSYRKPGLSKERRLEPQIVIGLLVDQSGFPLGLHSFEGNKAETKTILPVVKAFCSQHGVKSLTVVADAAMLSSQNLADLVSSGYTYIVGSRLHKIPYDIAQYQKTQTLNDQQIIVSQNSDYRVIYQYREKRAALDKRNIQKQIDKAQKIVYGQVAPTKAKFLTLKAKTKQLNQSLIDKSYALAGIKGYVTNLDIPDQQVIDYYHQLFQVEASFRMAKADLKARPIFHRKRDSIEAHLTTVLTALAIGRRIEAQTGISIKQLVKVLRPIRSGIVIINDQEYKAKEVIPETVQTILQKLGPGY
jgi:transposase